MQYITNIVFWLQAAMGAAAGSVGVASILFIFCLFVVGIGVGRFWNAKWKMGIAGFSISLIIALMTSTLGAVYMGMGFIKDTVLAASAQPTLVENCCKNLEDNSRLMEAAFRAGLKNLIDSGVETESLDPEALEFVIPGQSDEAKEMNMEQFMNGASKVIAKGEPAKKGGKVTVVGMDHQKPFSYGFEPVSRNNQDLLTDFKAYMSEREGMPLSLEDTSWYNTLVRSMTDNSLKSLSKTICGDIDSQRSALIAQIAILIILQLGLISWLALTDIRPQTRSLPAVK